MHMAYRLDALQCTSTGRRLHGLPYLGRGIWRFGAGGQRDVVEVDGKLLPVHLQERDGRWMGGWLGGWMDG